MNLSIFESKVLAQELPSTPITGLEVNSVSDLIIRFTNLLIIVGIALVALFLALGFIKYITSQGDKNAVDSAQKTLTYAVIGGIGLLLVYGLRELIIRLIGGDTADIEGY